MRLQTVGIVGLGLIGGSLAMTFKRRTNLTVCGYDRDASTCEKAAAAGAVDRADGPLRECDALFVALYPGAACEYVRTHAEEMRPGAIVSDLCGVKRAVQREMEPVCRAAGLRYVGAHPMAGRELSGFDNAQSTLFEGASMILTPSPDADAEALTTLETLFYESGFGRVVRTSPGHHDRMIAYTSQLAHILSSAYIQNPLAQDYSGFTGGSFQDLTRVARLSADMWGELFLKNSDELTGQIDVLIERLTEYKRALLAADHTALWTLMETGTQIKSELLRRTSGAPHEKLESE